MTKTDRWVARKFSGYDYWCAWNTIDGRQVVCPPTHGTFGAATSETLARRKADALNAVAPDDAEEVRHETEPI